ncbi:uncharacterized protein si:ch211-145b13.6 isoform X2 [Puntigrus tetrazona]|uniref:uncharacterized protein si:ch211-145b13.6 isoform X2 n=1 Tax=Puntigrus tetrazona TaxID=1606681 RepID=UPI001C8A7496|nr:uncharacterized protein si:ch211-145b13.6 isoform X2 [Puntigrus tetrazona]
MGRLRFPVIPVVLLYTTVLQTTEEVIQMGMFPEAADYSFQNCRSKMLQMVTESGGLLQTELNNNPDFKAIWQDSAACSETIPGDAVQLLGQNKCCTVYFGTEKEYNTKIGEKVRFESFVAATVEHSAAAEDASDSDSTGTVFNIISCSLICYEDYKCISEEILSEREFFISPNEVFTVKAITTRSGTDTFKEITLTHSDFQSSSNCSSLDRLPKESKASSSSFLSSSSLNLMASLLPLYYYTLTL